MHCFMHVLLQLYTGRSECTGNCSLLDAVLWLQRLVTLQPSAFHGCESALGCVSSYGEKVGLSGVLLELQLVHTTLERLWMKEPAEAVDFLRSLHCGFEDIKSPSAPGQGREVQGLSGIHLMLLASLLDHHQPAVQVGNEQMLVV
jgi:hypothetical protein